jgi:tetratricopeptide (TPR) repeat protein
MPGQPEAESWFAAEQPVLLALVGYAERHRADRHAWPLAWAVADFLQQRGPWTEWAAAAQLALAAAQRLAEPEAEARTRHYLGYARARLADYPSAHEHFDAALRLFGQLGDQANQAHVHLTASIMLELQGRPPGEALDRARQALDGYRAAGHRAGEANALNAVGWYLTKTGQHEQAVPYCQEAIDLHRELGNRDGEAATWDSLAQVHQDLGDHGRAIECYLVALELRPGPADRYNQAATLTGLGDTYLAAGQPDAARAAWRQALDILEGLHHPGAEGIRDRLG